MNGACEELGSALNSRPRNQKNNAFQDYAQTDGLNRSAVRGWLRRSCPHRRVLPLIPIVYFESGRRERVRLLTRGLASICKVSLGQQDLSAQAP
jgi:hypothetical protein